MFFAHGREYVDAYYDLLGNLKFENIHRLKVLPFTYKFKNDRSNTPAVLLNILTPVKTSLSHQHAPIMVYVHLNSLGNYPTRI